MAQASKKRRVVGILLAVELTFCVFGAVALALVSPSYFVNLVVAFVVVTATLVALMGRPLAWMTSAVCVLFAFGMATPVVLGWFAVNVLHWSGTLVVSALACVAGLFAWAFVLALVRSGSADPYEDDA